MCKTDYYPHSLEYVPDRYITREMCFKAVDTYASTLRYVSICYKTHKICEKAICKESFMLKYFLSKYKSQEICSKVVNAYPPLLIFVPDLCFTNEIVKDLDNAVSFNDNIVFVNADSDNVTFLIMIWCVNVNLNNTSLGNKNCDSDHPKFIIDVRLMTLCTRYEQRKAYTKRNRTIFDW